MDRLKQIETFVAVATKGSLTAAAQGEGVAPAIIGRRMDALEARLGVKLLLRTTRRISLTHEGSAFLEDCQRLIADFNNAEASVSAGGVKASGHLRVTAPAGFGRLQRGLEVLEHRLPHPPQKRGGGPSGLHRAAGHVPRERPDPLQVRVGRLAVGGGGGEGDEEHAAAGGREAPAQRPAGPRRGARPQPRYVTE